MRTSQAKNPAITKKETTLRSNSQTGCTPLQQLLHSCEELTWPSLVVPTYPSQSGLATNKLSYMVLSSYFPEPSLFHITQREPQKAAATIPKQMKSYQYTTIAMVDEHTTLALAQKKEDQGSKGGRLVVPKIGILTE